MSFTIKDCMPCSLKSDICHPYIKDVVSVMIEVTKEAKEQGMDVQEAEILFMDSSSMLRRGWTYSLAVGKPFVIVTRMFDMLRIDSLAMKDGQFMFASNKVSSDLAEQLCDELEKSDMFVTCAEYNRVWAREDIIANLMMKNFGIDE